LEQLHGQRGIIAFVHWAMNAEDGSGYFLGEGQSKEQDGSLRHQMPWFHGSAPPKITSINAIHQSNVAISVIKYCVASAIGVYAVSNTPVAMFRLRSLELP
jgi:hypothetical protein